MALSISYLKAAVDAGSGLTSAANYEAFFILPKGLESDRESLKPATLSILCQSIGFPGRQIATAELPVYGPPVKMPYGLVYQDLNISFLCTNDMAQRKLFDEWQRIIVDPTTNYANYYDNYVGSIVIYKLDQRDRVGHAVYVEEAYPVAVFEQEMAAGANDWLRLTVQFAYRRWRSYNDITAASKNADLGQAIPTPPNGADFVDDPFKGIKVPNVPKFNS